MLRSLGRDREATSGLLDRSTYGFLFRSHTIAFNPPSLDTGIPGTRTLLSGSVRNRTPSTSGLESDRLPQPHSQVLNLQRFKFVSRAAISPVSPAVHASDQKTPRDSTDFSGAQIWWSVSSWRAPYHIGVSLSSTGNDHQIRQVPQHHTRVKRARYSKPEDRPTRRSARPCVPSYHSNAHRFDEQ